jgi:serine/threonine protein phosphatase PrpC
MDVMLGSTAGKQEMTEIYKASDNKQSPLMQILKGDTQGGGDGSEDLALDAKGCTANVIMIKDGMIYCSNAGDSRAVVCNNGVAENMSEDHKPDNKQEKDRIYKAGSTVTEGRVDGNLNLSRSIGDLKHKQVPNLLPSEQPITCVPDVKVRPLKDGDEYILIACDGIWEQKSS